MKDKSHGIARWFATQSRGAVPASHMLPISKSAKVLVTQMSFLFALLSTACERPQQIDANTGKNVSKNGLPASAMASVVPIETGRETIRQCTRSTPWGVVDFWYPDLELASDIDARLPLVIDSVLRQVPGIVEPPTAEQYYRQYIGVVRWNGRRTVYINAFHRDHLKSVNSAISGAMSHTGGAGQDTFEWRRQPVSVCDGGLLFFGVEFDPQTRQFGRVEFNRRATGPVDY
jgi:hypothetical protein